MERERKIPRTWWIAGGIGVIAILCLSCTLVGGGAYLIGSRQGAANKEAENVKRDKEIFDENFRRGKEIVDELAKPQSINEIKAQRGKS